ncbi:MAG TPA: ATP-binding protein [Armatimonadota bacterium]|nr:ATP-binding protein [Armatimonadota bacterium]
MTSLRTLFALNFAAATVVPLLALALFLLQDQELAGRQSLDRELWLGVSMARQMFASQPEARVQSELARLHPNEGLRLTVIGANGRVLGDNESDPTLMENHLDRAEVRQALAEGVGRAERLSPTLGVRMRYLAVSTGTGSGARVYRAAVSMTQVQSQVRRTQFTLLAAIVGVALISLFAAARLSRQIVAPVEALSEAARRFSGGDSNAHVIPDGPTAMHRLGVTFNMMVERLSSQVRRLDEAQGYLEAVIRHMPDGLLVIDSRRVITRANVAAEALLRLTGDRILGRPVLAVLMHYGLDAEIRRVLEGSRTGGGGDIQGLAVELRTPDGKRLRAAVGPLFIGPQPSGVVVILQDVSELRRADEMRRDFVANVSHELRTPVAAIRALMETLLLRSERRPELLRDYGPRIVGECERIDRLVQDLLLLAQTESGHLRLQPESLDPRQAAEEVVRQVEPVAASSGTRLELESFAPDPVAADRFALGQCVRNLVDNAVRYAAGGTVRLGSRVEGEHVVLYVADDGPGIPAEDQPRIFERFYRVDKARSREDGGSGLGLSIVRHLAETQGGRTWVESQLGSGTTFYLQFPKCAPPDVSPGLPPADHEGEGGMPPDPQAPAV